MQSVSAGFTQRVARDALRFAEADVNGDNKLSQEEFVRRGRVPNWSASPRVFLYESVRICVCARVRVRPP